MFLAQIGCPVCPNHIRRPILDQRKKERERASEKTPRDLISAMNTNICEFKPHHKHVRHRTNAHVVHPHLHQMSRTATPLINTHSEY